MLIYPQQYVIDYPLHVGAHLPASWLGRSIVSITLTYPQQDVIYNPLQIGAPPERKGEGYGLHQTLWIILRGQDSGLHAYFNNSDKSTNTLSAAGLQLQF